ncbi:MAG: type II secretion system F family protein [Planctomycetota bacterium]
MPVYRTKVRKHTGETVEQTLVVPRESQLGEYLARTDGFVLDCVPLANPTSPAAESSTSTVPARDPRLHRSVRAHPSDLLSFTWYLFTLASAGVPLARALDIIQRQIDVPEWKLVIGHIISCLERGESLADSMRQFPRFFPTQYVHMVDVGEISGNMTLVLEDLAKHYERQLESRARVKSALAYPVLLMLACVVVIFFLIAFILPRIAKMFVKVGTELPWVTEALLTLSGFLRSHIPHLAVALGAAVALYGFASKTPRGRFVLAKIQLRAPLIGKLYQKFLIANFCQTLALLQRSGVSLLVSLRLSRQGVPNVVLEEFLAGVEKNLQEGSSLGEELARSPFVPTMVSSMITVGEETGQLAEMLAKVSYFYEREIEQFARTIPKIVEPAVIVLMTGVVGLLAASVFVPLSKLAKGFG